MLLKIALTHKTLSFCSENWHLLYFAIISSKAPWLTCEGLSTTLAHSGNQALSTMLAHSTIVYWILQLPLQLLSEFGLQWSLAEGFGHGFGWYIESFTSPIHNFTAREPCIIHNIVIQCPSIMHLPLLLFSVFWGEGAYAEGFSYGIGWYMNYFTSPIHIFTAWEPGIIHNFGTQYPSMLYNASSIATAFSVLRRRCLSRGIYTCH